MVCVKILGLLWVCYGLLCGMLCVHLYATIGLEDEVVIA